MRPDGTTNATTFVLNLPAGPNNNVSTTASNVTSGTHYFTYLKGFGGKGQKYILTGWPSNMDFQDYVNSGTWKP